MSFFTKIINAVTGNLATEIFDTVKAYFPPSMTAQEKAQVQLALKQLQDKREAQALQAEAEAEQRLNQRIKELEGTASDLKNLRFLGPMILFLRGCQRPLWGYLTMYMDVMWFCEWTLNDQQQTAMIAINLLVLGFLFGERAIKNLEPLLIKLWGKHQKE